MDEGESVSHTKWECKSHVVFIPKCRRRVLYGELRRHLGEVFRKLAEQEESRIEEGHARPRAHDDRDTAQVCGVARDCVYQREERNPSGSGVWGEKEELCGAALLGARILRIHSEAR